MVGPKTLAEVVENPFSNRQAGLVAVHSGTAIIRGDKGSQKDGYTMKRYCVLVFDNAERAGFILCFKTKTSWDLFQTMQETVLTDDIRVDWSDITKDPRLDKIIALKDAHVDNSELPEEKKESFIKQSNEIFIYTAKAANNSTSNTGTDGVGASVTSCSLDGHYIIFNEVDYIEWIGHIQKMANVEKKAMKFRQKQKTERPAVSNSNLVQSQQQETEEKTVMNDDDDGMNEQQLLQSTRVRCDWRKIVMGILSVLVSLLAVGYWQYVEYQEYLAMMARQRLQEEEAQRQEEARRQEEELRMMKSNELNSKQSLEKLDNEINEDLEAFTVYAIALVLVLLSVSYVVFRCCCRKRQTRRWQRDSKNGRLSSRF